MKRFRSSYLLYNETKCRIKVIKTTPDPSRQNGGVEGEFGGKRGGVNEQSTGKKEDEGEFIGNKENGVNLLDFAPEPPIRVFKHSGFHTSTFDQSVNDSNLFLLDFDDGLVSLDPETWTTTPLSPDPLQLQTIKNDQQLSFGGIKQILSLSDSSVLLLRPKYVQIFDSEKKLILGVLSTEFFGLRRIFELLDVSQSRKHVAILSREMDSSWDQFWILSIFQVKNRSKAPPPGLRGTIELEFAFELKLKTFFVPKIFALKILKEVKNGVLVIILISYEASGKALKLVIDAWNRKLLSWCSIEHPTLQRIKKVVLSEAGNGFGYCFNTRCQLIRIQA